jgi:flagellar hook-associated protein 3 FlgL
MRITTRWLQQSALGNLRKGTAALAKAQKEASTGRRVDTVSDDPLDAGHIMQMNAQLRDIDRYRRNGNWATARMATEDTVLTGVRTLLDKAVRIATTAASLPATDPARMEAATQIQQLREQVISLGNTKVGQEYLFAGGRSTNPAFLASGMFLGDGTIRQVEIDDGVRVDTADSGSVLVPALNALNRLGHELQTGTTTAVTAAVGDLIDSNTGVLRVQTALGSRMSEVSEQAARLLIRASKTAERRDTLRSIDSAEAAVNLTSAQTALQQAYATVVKVLSINIIDYLR